MTVGLLESLSPHPAQDPGEERRKMRAVIKLLDSGFSSQPVEVEIPDSGLNKELLEDVTKFMETKKCFHASGGGHEFPLTHAGVDFISSHMDGGIPKGIKPARFLSKIFKEFVSEVLVEGNGEFECQVKKLSPDIAGGAGDKLAAAITNRRTVHCSVDFDIGWDAGSFHDEGSCFWTCHIRAREYMEINEEFFGFRFHGPEDVMSEGTGRCWGMITGESVILWNAYSGHDRLMDFARAMQSILGEEYSCKRINVHDAEYVSGAFYINGGGLHCEEESKFSAVVVTKDCATFPERFDFETGLGDGEEDEDICQDCGYERGECEC